MSRWATRCVIVIALFFPAASWAGDAGEPEAVPRNVWVNGGLTLRTPDTIFSAGVTASMAVVVKGYVVTARYAAIGEMFQGLPLGQGAIPGNSSLALLGGHQYRNGLLLADFGIGPALIWAEKRGAKIPYTSTGFGPSFDFSSDHYEKVDVRAWGMAVQGGIFASGEATAIGLEFMADLNAQQIMPTVLLSVRLGLCCVRDN